MTKALVAGVAMAALALAAPAQATLPGKNGKIAFAHSAPESTRNVFTVNPDGTGLQNLTNLRANSFAPVWSPDGTRLAFESDLEPSGVGGDSYYNVFTIGADGGGLTQVTHLEGATGQTWSPAGDALAYVSEGQVHRIAADGTRPQRLASGHAPAWSPDGERIAFSGADGRLHTISATGDGERVLTTAPVNTIQWSPNGSMLAFEALGVPPCQSPRGFCWSIGVVGADGRGERIVSRAVEAYGPDWSPDGARIAYFGALTDGDVFVVGADGSNHVRLTGEPEFQRAPVWSPDGTMLAFLGGGVVDGVEVMNADGSGQRFLAEGHGELSWQSIPDRRRCKAIWKRGQELSSCIRRAHRGH